MKLKYIRYQTKLGDYIVVFPDAIMHRDIRVRVAYQNDAQIISAGFIDFEIGNPPGDRDYYQGFANCYGQSDSLGIKSLEEDSDIATKQFFGD